MSETADGSAFAHSLWEDNGGRNFIPDGEFCGSLSKPDGRSGGSFFLWSDQITSKIKTGDPGWTGTENLWCTGVLRGTACGGSVFKPRRRARILFEEEYGRAEELSGRMHCTGKNGSVSADVFTHYIKAGRAVCGGGIKRTSGIQPEHDRIFLGKIVIKKNKRRKYGRK